MSWQERIERYKQEEERREQEEANRQRQERLEILREKIPPLLETLERFNCRELLTSIRDEVWKLGDVSTEPDLDNITEDNDPRQAEVILEASWPYYVPAHYYTTGSGDNVEEKWAPASIATDSMLLAIHAVYKPNGDIVLLVNREKWKPEWRGYSFIGEDTNYYWRERAFREGINTKDEKATILLENSLIKDCVFRAEECAYEYRVPYDQTKKRSEREIIRAIRAGELPSVNVPKEFDYFLDLAKKAQRETVETQPRVPRKGFLDKLFGGQ